MKKLKISGFVLLALVLLALCVGLVFSFLDTERYHPFSWDVHQPSLSERVHIVSEHPSCPIRYAMAFARFPTLKRDEDLSWGEAYAGAYINAYVDGGIQSIRDMAGAGVEDVDDDIKSLVGTVKHMQKGLKRAERLLQCYVAFDPEGTDSLSAFYEYQQRYAEAASVMREYAATHQDNIYDQMHLARLYRLAGEPDKAVEIVHQFYERKMIQQSDRQEGAIRLSGHAQGVGLSYWEAGDLANARDFLLSAARDSRELPKISLGAAVKRWCHFAAAAFLDSQGETETADALYKEAFADLRDEDNGNMDEVEFLFDYAGQYEYEGYFKGSEFLMKRGLALSAARGDDEAFLEKRKARLAKLYERRGRKDEAEQLMGQAVSGLCESLIGQGHPDCHPQSAQP